MDDSGRHQRGSRGCVSTPLEASKQLDERSTRSRRATLPSLPFEGRRPMMNDRIKCHFITPARSKWRSAYADCRPCPLLRVKMCSGRQMPEDGSDVRLDGTPCPTKSRPSIELGKGFTKAIVLPPPSGSQSLLSRSCRLVLPVDNVINFYERRPVVVERSPRPLNSFAPGRVRRRLRSSAVTNLGHSACVTTVHICLASLERPSRTALIAAFRMGYI